MEQDTAGIADQQYKRHEQVSVSKIGKRLAMRA